MLRSREPITASRTRYRHPATNGTPSASQDVRRRLIDRAARTAAGRFENRVAAWRRSSTAPTSRRTGRAPRLSSAFADLGQHLELLGAGQNLAGLRNLELAARPCPSPPRRSATVMPCSGLNTKLCFDFPPPLQQLHHSFRIDAGNAIQPNPFNVVGRFDAERFQHRRLATASARRSCDSSRESR